MIVGVPTEIHPGENRVALIPSDVRTLAKLGLGVHVETGAGAKAGFTDDAYNNNGAQLSQSRSELFSLVDVVLMVHGTAPNLDGSYVDIALSHPGQVVLGLLNPLTSFDAVHKLAEGNVTSFALELMPRISRAQPMDALTSMATIMGYKAALMAADVLPKIYPMMMTAAGTVNPAHVFVIGAGVAGLQAIATSRRLGGVVQAYDVRPAVKQQVESLGARFLELSLHTDTTEATGGYARTMDEEFYRLQRELMGKAIAESDVVITTAAIPGNKAPTLITEDMVQGMRPGSVIVDVAAESGGNCALTQPGESVISHGVSIYGPTNLASSIPYHASQMYSKNLTAFLNNLIKDNAININMDDQIISDTLVTHEGQVVNTVIRTSLGLPDLLLPNR